MSMKDFDAEILLEHLMGDEEIAREILQIYVESSADLLRRIDSACAKGDMEELALHAHSLKGASANVGAERLRTLSEKAEHTSRIDGLDTAKQIMTEIEQAHSDFLSEAKDQGWISPNCCRAG